jgi:hypothetical protein
MTFETAKVRFLNMVTSTTGCSCLRSHRTNETSATPAITVAMVMKGEENHSSSWPLSSTISSAPRPTAIKASPT